MKTAWRDKLKFFWKKSWPYFCIALVSILAISLFLNENYPDGHDLEYHAASVVGISENDLPGIFTSKIFGTISNNLGYGEGLFYPPFSHITASLIYKFVNLFGMDIFFAFKVFYFLLLFFSGVFMRKFILLITKNQKAAIFSAIFYITFPYLLMNILIRSAMAESTVFVFMPIVLIGLYHLLHDNYKKFLIYFTIGCVGMVNSHLLMTLFFTIFCIIGFLPKIKLFFTKKRILYLAISIIFTTLMSLPFLLPMLENKANAEYNVFLPGFMTNVENMQYWRVQFGAVLSLDKTVGNVPVYINIFGLIILAYTIVRYKQVRTSSNAIYLSFAIIITLISIILSSTLFSWEHIPSIFLLLQFPFRLVSFVALGMAILVGLAIPSLDSKYGDLLYIVFAIPCIFGISQVNSQALANIDLDVDNLKYSASYCTDYLPIVSPAYPTNDYINTYDRSVRTNSDEVEILEVTEKVPNMSFKISGITDQTQITLPRYYYLGYSIKAHYENGEIEDLPYRMSDEGFITFDLDKDAEIMVDYPGTSLQRNAYAIAETATLIFIIYMIAWRPSKKSTGKA